MSEQYKRHPNTKCIVCGKSIYKRPSEIEGTDGRVFCSQICYGISCRKEVPCIVCGKPILAGLHKKTCSRACSNKHRTGIRYNVQSLKDKVKTSQALKLRLSIERGRKCEKCAYDKFEILQVHHRDRNRSNNKLVNLELVCPNCHYEEHYLGRK